MTDIVERLLEKRGVLDNRWPGPTNMDLEAAAEIERLRKIAKELSDALLTVRPLGGSELFKRHGNTFYADPLYCSAAIRQMREELHELKCNAVRAGKIDATLSLMSPSQSQTPENTGGGQS